MNDPKLALLLTHFPGWRFDERFLAHCWCAVIIDDEGHGIHFNTQQKTGRYYISGCWPRGKSGIQLPDHCPHITVALLRPADEIAAEIKRRFLPDYLEQYNKAKAIADATDDRDKQIAAVRQELIEFLGIKPSQNGTTLYGPGYTRIDVQSPDSVRVECRGNFSLKTAKRVLALLKKVDDGK
jgi:hypothetical protein